MSRGGWFGIAIVVVAVIILLAVVLPRDGDGGAIKMGATFPLTGEVASYGVKAKRGIELATAERNAGGGILGRQVVIDFQDDRNNKQEAVSIVTRFCTVDRVPVIFGSAGSTVSLAIAPVANRNKVLLVSPVSSSSQLSTDGGPYFFRTVPADDSQARVLAEWVHGYGARKVVVVYTNNSWGKPLADGFVEKFKALGGEVALSEGATENTADFRMIITKIKRERGIDAVVSPTYPKEGGTFVRQAKELDLEIKLFGGDNWVSPEFRDIAGDAAEGVFFTALEEAESRSFDEFSASYEARFGEEADILAAYAYDAAEAVYRAVESCGSVDPAQVREALLAVSFGGVSGTISFLPNGDLAREGCGRMTIKNGKSVPVE